jgi:molybdenum-dependent DNA-binding transcriptional regulator ModE
MEDKLIMSKKELERKTILDGVISGKLELNEAARRMRVSYRQARRIYKRYQAESDPGLQHKNRGRKPHNAYTKQYKQIILALYRSKYMEFGPTFAAEKLIEDDGHAVNAETLRLWLKEDGLWSRMRKHNVYRERRERRPNFGDLLQIDGSIHRWFAGDDEKSCLLNMVDDATGVTMALLDTGETTKVLLTTFKKWVETYGVPKAVYVDLKSVYVSPKPLKEKYDDDLLIQEGFSVFQQVCKQLNIEIIRAYSPQAKGRVERKHGVFQDRFVKDLKLYNIKTIAAANIYLEEKFLDKINSKFAQAPEGMQDSHRDCSTYGDLDQIFCWQYKRQLKNDWTIQLQRQYYQVEKPKEGVLAPEMKICIKRYLDGAMRFWYEGEELTYRSLAVKPEPPSRSKKRYQAKGYDQMLKSSISRRNKHRTPWGQFTPNWLKKVS